MYLEKLFNEILLQLKEESIKYKKLKICKYSFEISKVCILSLATGLSFINIFAILSMILIPVIDTTKHTANVDQRLSNFDDIIGKKFNTITNNVFCLSHPKNALIIGKTNSGKTNILMNLIAQNSIYEKIYIYTNNLDDKYKWLKNKFKDDVFIYINEINFDKINKDYVNLIIFDDLVFSNKKISEFYCRSRKLNCSTIFIGHRYFKNIDRTLKNNIDYLIFTQLDKKELNMLYQDISLDISLKEFQDINTNLKRYDFILIDKYNKYKFMRIRKNLDQIYICK